MPYLFYMKKNTKTKEIIQSVGNSVSVKNKIIISAVLVNLILRLYIASQPFEFIDGPFIQDDSYYVLTIAKNIANGSGPLYTDSYTNGFQPLYVFLIVPVFLFIKSDLFAPIRAMLVINAFLDTLTLFLLLKIFYKARSYLTLILLSVLWILSFTVIINSLNGLETPLSVLSIVLTLYLFQKFKDKDTYKNLVLLGGGVGLCLLSRIDNIFFSGAVLLFYFIYNYKNKISIRETAKKVIIIMSAAIIIYLPWAVYSYAYTGDIFPVSGKALRLISFYQVDRNPTYDNWYSLLISAAFKIIYANNYIFIFLFVFCLALLIFLKMKGTISSYFKELSPAGILLISNLILILSYIFYFFGYWYFSRYFYPVTLMFIILSAVTFDNLEGRSAKIKAIQVPVIIAVFVFSVFTPEFKYLFYDSTKNNTGFMNIGLWAQRNFKPGTIIAASQSGAIGYFAHDMKVINLDGVVNKDSYNAIEEKRFMDYIRSKKVEFIIGWPSNFTMIVKNSTGIKERDLQPMGKITEFKTMNTQWNLARVIY